MKWHDLYGASVKAEALYMSAYQLIPYNRSQDLFRDQAQIELSCGTLHNFAKGAYKLLEGFEDIARACLIEAPLAHFDETGINVMPGSIVHQTISGHSTALIKRVAKKGLIPLVCFLSSPALRAMTIGSHISATKTALTFSAMPIMNESYKELSRRMDISGPKK